MAKASGPASDDLIFLRAGSLENHDSGRAMAQAVSTSDGKTRLSCVTGHGSPESRTSRTRMQAATPIRNADESGHPSGYGGTGTRTDDPPPVAAATPEPSGRALAEPFR